MAKVLGAVAASLALLKGTLADLPVHCVRHQLIGDWDFELGPPSPQRTSCGHQRPDVQEVQPVDIKNKVETKRITLSDPDTASTAKDSAGTFTLIYDEGFEVRAENMTFFAFSRYDLSPKGKNVSRCGETARGWYRNADRTQWGCYTARKVHQPLSLISVIPPVAPVSPGYDKPLSLASLTEKVRRINSRDGHWKAKVYDRFVGKSMREINSMAGIRRSIPRSPAKAPVHGSGNSALLEVGQESCPEAPAMARPKAGNILSRLMLKGQSGLKPCQLRQQAKMYFQPPSAATLAVEAELPASFDWRNARGGRNFLEPVMDQGDCGSCYMVSTMRMLSARHKVRQNDTSLEPWSISFPLHCSEYNQGCKGGYGFLASKWSEDVGLLPASCAPYNTAGTCSLSCDPKKIQKRFRAANHRYIGGFYGNSSSAEMMMEVYKNGPVVVSFEPTDDFMFYAGGIFGQPKLGVPAPLHEHGAEWQQVDHAVLLIGWGEELGQKFWIVQNSWGNTWGEDGFFRMARDINDSGVESIAVASDVVEEEKPEVLHEFLAQNNVKV